MTLENLIGKGLQREPASAEEIHRFLAKITTKLAPHINLLRGSELARESA